MYLTSVRLPALWNDIRYVEAFPRDVVPRMMGGVVSEHNWTP